MPALRRDRAYFWTVLSLRPGADPLRAIAEAFNPQALGDGAASYATKIGDETEALGNGRPHLLVVMIDQHLQRADGQPDRLPLYVDHWEELYAEGAVSTELDQSKRR